MSVRLTIARNGNAQIRTVAVVSTIDEVFKTAKNKLQVKKPQRIFQLNGTEVLSNEQLSILAKDSIVVVSSGEDFVGVVKDDNGQSSTDTSEPAAIVTVLANNSWLDDEAVAQLRKTATLKGIRIAAGMPDLHPGKGFPVGAAFASSGLIYPALIGNDIGCGMALYQTSLIENTRSNIKLATQLQGLEGSWRGDLLQWLLDHNLKSSTEFDSSMGTIGAGNHFAELQKVHSVLDKDSFAALNLDPNALFLLVHSGSRSLGASVLDSVVQKHGTVGLEANSPFAQEYMNEHDYACRWAQANRELIARRVLDCIGADANKILDIWHNNVTLKTFPNGENLWLHRKGAAPADCGPIVIPGSRGTFSYLLQPISDQENNAYSLAHGAGRKWNRSKALTKVKENFQSSETLLKTALGSVVICEDKTLLYEEAPEAYKDIDDIIKDMQEAKLVHVIAIFQPVVTYKMRME